MIAVIESAPVGAGTEAGRAPTRRLGAAAVGSVLIHAGLAVLLSSVPPAGRPAYRPHNDLRPVLSVALPARAEAARAATGMRETALGDGMAPARASGALSFADGRLAGLPPATYLARTRLDRPPKPLDEPALDFPDAEAGQSGRVVLELFIDSRGRVDFVEVRQSSLPGSYAEAAAQGFRTIRFTPGERGGRPVGSRFSVEVRYEHEGH